MIAKAERTKVFGSRHPTDPKPSLNNALILELFITLEVQLKYYKVI